MRTLLRAAAALALLSGAPVLAQTPPATIFTHGQVTFSQNGHDVTWLLWQGSLRPVAELVPAAQAGLLFTPDGKPGPEDGGSLFRLVVKKSRDTYTLEGLAVENGPGGSGIASHREPKSKCRLKVTQFDEKSLSGSVICLGDFTGGATVTSALFSATP